MPTEGITNHPPLDDRYRKIQLGQEPFWVPRPIAVERDVALRRDELKAA